MSMQSEELEQVPPQGHVKVVYLGPVAPHWEVHGVFGDGRMIDEFRQRAVARLQFLARLGERLPARTIEPQVQQGQELRVP